MVEKWNDYELTTSMVVNGNEYSFKADFRNILEAMKPLNDPDLLEEEKIDCACYLFFDDYENISQLDMQECVEQMMVFISGNKPNEQQKNDKPLMDWEKDLSIIIAPINKVATHDIRNDNFMHWWTFLAYFMEIGECTFNTFVGIRNKKNKGKKLEKFEQDIYKNNMKAINLEKKYDRTTQDMIDEILGKR